MCPGLAINVLVGRVEAEVSSGKPHKPMVRLASSSTAAPPRRLADRGAGVRPRRCHSLPLPIDLATRRATHARVASFVSGKVHERRTKKVSR